MDQNSEINTVSDLSYDSSVDEKDQKDKGGNLQFLIRYLDGKT